MCNLSLGPSLYPSPYVLLGCFPVMIIGKGETGSDSGRTRGVGVFLEGKGQTNEGEAGEEVGHATRNKTIGGGVAASQKM